MRITRSVWVVLLVLSVLAGPAERVLASPPSGGQPCLCDFAPLSHQKCDGPATIRLTLTGNTYYNCSDLGITLEGVDGVRCVGDTTWKTSIKSGETIVRDLNLIIPVKDTSAVYVHLACHGIPFDDLRYYFVTTEDTIEFWKGDPRGIFPLPKHPVVYPRLGDILIGEFPEDDSLWGIPRLEPVLLPASGGTAEMKLTYSPVLCGCKEVTATVQTQLRLTMVSERVWRVPLDSGVPVVSTLRFTLPPNDTSAFLLDFWCGGAHYQLRPFFVTTGATTEYYPSNPWGREPHMPPPTLEEKRRDSILAEINATPMSTRYKVDLTTCTDEQLQFVRSVSDCVRLIETNGSCTKFSCTISKFDLRECMKRGVRLSKILQFSPGSQNQRQDSDRFIPKPTDSSGGIGGKSSGAIWLPDLTWCWSYPWSGEPIWIFADSLGSGGAFYEGEPLYLKSCVVNVGQMPVALTFFGNIGVGNNARGWDLGGLGINFQEVIGPYGMTPNIPGLQSAFFLIDKTSNVVESNETNNMYEQSIYVWPATITYQGYLYYKDLSLPGPDNVRPMRGVRVEMWDYDATSFDDLLKSTTSGEDGYFQLWNAENSEPGGSKLDVYLKIYAENSASYVEDGSGTTWVIQTPRRDQHPSGIFDTTIVADNARCGPFFIADAILTARDKWTALGGWNPGQTQVVSAHAYNGTTGGSFYVPSTQTIYIESGEDLIQGFPDTFDRDIIVHEYAHRLQDNSDFFDRNPGDDHHWYIESSDSMAASEGWATFLSCCLKDTPNSVLRSLSNSFRDTLWYNSENGTWGKNYSTNGSANAMGETCEAAVAGALWDIFDSSPTLEDYSGWGDRGHVTLPHHPDGVGDSLSVSATQINNVLLTRYVNGRHPQTFPEFFQAWCSNPTMDHRQALSDICYEHGFACCIGVYGNVDGDPDEVVDSSDLFGIIDVMTLGRPIPCMGEADMVQDGVIDISDMFAMIDFLNGVVSLSPCT